ncbi:MAG TPA: thioredoxin domain-containing protein [Candidatus Aquilonibacter sp.]|nr:thioredoxin domain-containing protein [Candidatus Aquilonibacter sp.]
MGPQVKLARKREWIGALAFGCVLTVGLWLASARLSAAAGQEQRPAGAHRVAAHSVSELAAPVKTYGMKSAPITVVAFTDYQCPGCRALYEEALKPMIADYVASGKVYLIHHDFPLAMHQYSGQAARWANASAMVGDFGPAEAALFDNQPSWAENGDISKYVQQALPPADFRRVEAIMKDCTTPAPQATTPDVDPLGKSGHGCPVDAYIAPDIKMGFGVPVNYTPTYIIYYEGQKIASSSDIVSWPILKQFFDSLLNR